jgi:hypothetical protein
MQSDVLTVEAYLRSLPADRACAIATVRDVMLKNLDPRYEEGMPYGMIGYYVPHSVYPKGYHCNPNQPLPFAALGSQKNYMSLHLMSVYFGCVDDSAFGEYARWFREEWASTGKKLDMGKACIRFQKIDDVALDVIGEAVRRVPAPMYIRFCEDRLAHSAKSRGVK